VTRNGFKSQPVTQSLYKGQVVLKTWKDCLEHTEVALYLIKDWRHLWPGGSFSAALEEDDLLRNYDAAKTLWAFLKSHKRH
jgi:poly(3-hydroxybutyrate) depolymerase